MEKMVLWFMKFWSREPTVPESLMVSPGGHAGHCTLYSKCRLHCGFVSQMTMMRRRRVQEDRMSFMMRKRAPSTATPTSISSSSSARSTSWWRSRIGSSKLFPRRKFITFTNTLKQKREEVIVQSEFVLPWVYRVSQKSPLSLFFVNTQSCLSYSCSSFVKGVLKGCLGGEKPNI